MFNLYKKNQERIAGNVMRYVDPLKRMFGGNYYPLNSSIVFKDNVKGVPFKFVCKRLNIDNNGAVLLKVLPSEEGISFDNSMIEILICKLLTQDILMADISPCITFYYDSFLNVPNDSKCFSKLKLTNTETDVILKDTSNVLITEFLPEKDLYAWVESVYDENLTDDDWRSIIFQVVYTLSVLQDKYKFEHNDLSPLNVLVLDNNEVGRDMSCRFHYKGQDFLVYCPIFIKLWDFEYATLYNEKYNIENPIIKALSGDGYAFNPYKDIHYFLNSLLAFDLPEETQQFIEENYHKDILVNLYSDEKNDLLEIDEQLGISIAEKFSCPTPQQLLLSDKYFDTLKNTDFKNIFLDGDFRYS